MSQMKTRYFRSRQELQGIDPEALWFLDEETGRIVLVDEDQYLWEPFYENDPRFYEIEKPF
jgi:hypothetical protein